jgi:hypothetical protein
MTLRAALLLASALVSTQAFGRTASIMASNQRVHADPVSEFKRWRRK